jgi:hypothetical protein
VILSDRSDFPTRPCNESQLSQALLELDNLSTLGALPVGCVTWWTGSHTSLPHKWVIANGTDNHADLGGSGYNLINYFIMATATDSDVGDTTAATTETGEPSPHSHSDHTGYDTIPISTSLGNETVTFSINEDVQHPAADHTRTITLGDDTAVLAAGNSYHEHDLTSTGWSGIMDTELSVTSVSWNHEHLATITAASHLAHAAGDVVNLIADHGAHQHNIQPIRSGPNFEVNGGDAITTAIGANETTNVTMAHGDSGGSLTHENHDHDNTVVLGDDGGEQHTHNDVTQIFPPGHTHLVSWSDSEASSHTHNYLHSHPPKSYDKSDIPDHTLADQQHSHPSVAIQPSHRHSIWASPESSHTHTIENPENMTLIPIERMP